MDPLFIIYLGVAHWFADFICQTDWMAVNKSKRWDALILHVTIYSLVMAVLTLSGWFGMVTFVCHLATDAATSRMGRAVFPWTPVPARLLAFPSSPVYLDDEGGESWLWGFWWPRSRHWFFTVIGADQWLLHWPQLVLTAWWLL